MEDWSIGAVVALGAFVLGLVFGAVAQRTHFCTMGAIADIAIFGSWRRMRAWLLAIAIALVLAQAMHAAGVVDLRRSIYLGSGLGWAGAVLGGLLFGFGMVLAGGCASRNLVRAGAGSLKSLVVLLVLGLSAYMTLSGLLARPRLEIAAVGTLDLAAFGLRGQGLGDLLAAPFGIDPAWLGMLSTLVVAGLLAAFCLRDAAFRASRADVVAGIVVGLVVAGGWVVTGVLGDDDFDPTPLASLTFVAPTGQTLLYAMTSTGATIGFGVASVVGVVLGAFLAAMATGQFRFEAFTGTADMLRNIAGAVLMGFGGVLALGCTIGQGITGLSTLAAGSVLAVVAIVAGALVALRWLEAGSIRGTLRLLLGRGASDPAARSAANPCAAVPSAERAGRPGDLPDATPRA